MRSSTFAPSALPRQSSDASRSSISDVAESRRGKRVKQNEFTLRSGKRYHNYDVEKAPYPLSYDNEVLDIEGMHTLMLMSIDIDPSIVPEFNSGEKTPTRSLDLGCGQGLWVLHGAKTWPDTTFVGVDLVNIQVPLHLLDQSIARRVKWVHSNFLTTQLPFEDESFDHVRITFVARGVPENKWISLLEEVHRVLAPGGVVEAVDEDIIFPTLPRWFTSALRGAAQPLAERSPSLGSRAESNTLLAKPAHDYELLQSLFFGVFESRFINIQPTAIMPAYLQAVFSSVIAPKRPFFHPPFRFAPRRRGSTATETGSDPPKLSANQTVTFIPAVMPVPASFNPLESAGEPSSPQPFTIVASDSASSSGSDDEFVDAPTWDDRTFNPARLSTSTSFEEYSSGTSSGQSTNAWTIYGYNNDDISFADWFNKDERSMFMHLYIAVQNVLACREPMWAELSARVRKGQVSLKDLGASDGRGSGNPDAVQRIAQQKFDEMIKQYESDMQIRLSFADTLAFVGWPAPIRELLSKMQRWQQDRVLDAWERLPPGSEELPGPPRIHRGFWGYRKQDGFP